MVDVICGTCKSVFSKEKKEISRRIKNGYKYFYCKKKCIPYHDEDELSPFRIYIRLAKKNSQKRNSREERKFDLDTGFLKTLFDKQKGRCPYTGVKLEIGKNSNEKPYSLRAASLDRVDPTKGYTKNNVEFVCLFVNWGKNGFSKKEVKDLLGELVLISKTRDLQS